jgi:hypothetical protein
MDELEQRFWAGKVRSLDSESDCDDLCSEWSLSSDDDCPGLEESESSSDEDDDLSVSDGDTPAGLGEQSEVVRHFACPAGGGG